VGLDPESEDDPIVLRSTEQSVGGEWRILEPARRKLTSSDVSKALLYEGDLLVAKSSGSELHIGKTSFVTREVAALGACYSNFMQRLRLSNVCMPTYFHYILNNRLAREQLAYLSNSTTGLANLNGDLIGRLLVVLDGPLSVVHFVCEKTTYSLLVTLLCCPRSEVVLARCSPDVCLT